MKKIIIISLFAAVVFGLNARSTITFNGSFETKFEFNHSKNYPEFPYYYSYRDVFSDEPDYGQFTWGLKNLINLRMKANISEYLSFNLILFSILSGIRLSVLLSQE